MITLRFAGSDKICNGVSISGVAVGGLTRQEAEAAVRGWARERLQERVTLTALDTRWLGTVAGFGADIKWQKAIDQAFTIGRTGSIFSRMQSVLFSSGKEKKIRTGFALNKEELEKTIDKVADAVNKPRKDARLNVIGDELHIEQDVIGIKLDEKQAMAKVQSSLEASKQIIELPVVADRPLVTAQDARSITTLLARFTTRFNPGKRERTHNLTLAARSINGVILGKGQEFSYNNSVGPRISERGFQKAIIFVKGKMEDGIGGGICQVSSTLYNVALLSGMDIKERYPHSRTVPYTVPGRDATVAYGSRDFRFVNANDSPVGIVSRVTGSHLTVEIYGSPEDRKSIEIFTSRPKYTPVPGETTLVDNTLAPGARKVTDHGSRGVAVTVYRRVKSADGSTSTDVISHDKYPAQKAIVSVGPAPKPADVSSAATQ